MMRFAIAALVLAAAALAQEPALPAPPQQDSVEPVPLFRPKVVVHRQLVLPKDPFLGGALSLVMPGTGQAYCGRWGKGLAFLGGVVTSLALSGAIGRSEVLTDEAKSVGSGVFGLVALGLWAWNVVDGVHCANVHNRQLLESP